MDEERSVRYLGRLLRAWVCVLLLALGMHVGNKVSSLEWSAEGVSADPVAMRGGGASADAAEDAGDALIQPARPLDGERAGRLLHAAQYGDDLYRLRTRLAVLTDNTGP